MAEQKLVVQSADRIDFEEDSPQQYHHSWTRKDRLVRYFGKCIACDTRCYSHDDGEDDPRGMLGRNSLGLQLSPKDYSMNSDTAPGNFPMCFECSNEEHAYLRGIREARRIWGLSVENKETKEQQIINDRLSSTDRADAKVR